MKKICIFIVTLMLLLQSCNPVSVEEETLSKNGDIVDETHDDTVDINLTNLQFEPINGVISSTLEHTADITSFKTAEEVGSVNTAPVVCNDGQYTYLIRRFPEELKSAAEIMEFMKGARINEIEIYENNQYSQPVEEITLDALEGKGFSPYALSYNSEKEEFYLFVSESGDPTFYTFSRQGEMLNRNVISVNKLDEIMCLGGKVYVIGNGGYNGRAANLSVVDPVTDESAKLDENVIDIYTKDGILYYIKNTQTADYRNIQQICSYHPMTGAITTVKEIQTDESIVSVYYDSENDIVYFASTVKMFAYKDGEVMPIMDTYDANIEICSADNNHIFTVVGNNQVSVYQLTAEPASLVNQVDVLKVCIPATLGESAFETALSYAVDVMGAAGMPVRFEYTYIADDSESIIENNAEYANNMAKKFLANDTDYDIFILNSAMSELFDSQHYEDLSNYPVITDYYDKLIPGIKELCSIDGKIMLAPMTLFVDSMIFSPSALADPKQAPKTFDDFFNKYDELTASIGDNYYFAAADEINVIDKWLDEIASNYFAEIISDEIAENDLTKLFNCVAELDEYDKIYLGTDSADKSRMFSYYISNGAKSAGEEYNWVAWPKFGDKYKYSIDGTFLAVNPRSPNKELALKLIVYYLNSIVSGDYSSKMHFVQQDKLEASEDEIKKEVDYETSKYKSFTEQIADSIHKNMADDLFSFGKDICVQIKDGTLTSQEAASRTLRYLKMIRDE